MYVNRRRDQRLSRNETMKITRRQSVTGVLTLFCVFTALTAIVLVVQPSYENSPIFALLAVAVSLCSGGLLYAYRRGFDQARYVIVIAITLITGFVTPEPFVTQTATITFFVP